MRVIEGKYPEETNLSKYISIKNGEDVLYVVAKRFAAYSRDIIKGTGYVLSGYRSYEKQLELYNAYIKYKAWVDGGKVGTQPPYANLAAKPGTSWHNFGCALDVQKLSNGYQGTIQSDYDAWLLGKPEILNKYGLMHSAKGEPWHIQCIETKGYVGDRNNFLNSDDYQISESGEIVLKLGDKSPEVFELQTSLIYLGISVGASGADGSFGGATEIGVNLFKKNSGLPQDGLVDAKFYSALTKALRAKSASFSTSVDLLKKEIVDLKSKITNLTASIDGLTKEKTALAKSIEDLNIAKAIVEGNLVKKSTEYNVLISAHNKTVEDLRIASESLATKTVVVEDLQARINALDLEDDSLSAEILTLSVEIEVLRKQLSEKDLVVSNVQASLTQTESELKRCREGFSSMTLGEFFKTVFAIITKK